MATCYLAVGTLYKAKYNYSLVWPFSRAIATADDVWSIIARPLGLLCLLSLLSMPIATWLKSSMHVQLHYILKLYGVCIILTVMAVCLPYYGYLQCIIATQPPFIAAQSCIHSYSAMPIPIAFIIKSLCVTQSALSILSFPIQLVCCAYLQLYALSDLHTISINSDSTELMFITCIITSLL